MHFVISLHFQLLFDNEGGGETNHYNILNMVQNNNFHETLDFIIYSRVVVAASGIGGVVGTGGVAVAKNEVNNKLNYLIIK